MSEEEVRKIVREELISLLKNYNEVSQYEHPIINRRTGDWVGNYPYSKEEIINILINGLNGNEVEE